MLRVLDSTSASPDASPGQFPYTVRWKHTVASILKGLQAASGPRCGSVGPAGPFVRRCEPASSTMAVTFRTPSVSASRSVGGMGCAFWLIGAYCRVGAPSCSYTWAVTSRFRFRHDELCGPFMFEWRRAAIEQWPALVTETVTSVWSAGSRSAMMGAKCDS